MGAEFLELTTEESKAWNSLLDKSAAGDFYHRPEYHRLAERVADQRARLFAYQEGDHFIALPLILRPLPAEFGGGELLDATSVYGYAGPAFSDAAAVEKLGPSFRAALVDSMARHRVVTVFSRLNPLIEQEPVLGDLGDCPVVGETVSMDLTVPTDQRVRGYRSNHRRDIRRLAASGMTCEVDHEYQLLPEFERLYTETMSRVGAHERYRFDSQYFERLTEAGDPPPELIVCRAEGQVACAGLFFREGPLAQYHLSGTASDFHGKAPLKLLIHCAADRYHSEGLQTLHLGGGVGGGDDVLLHFKKGFSRTTHEFRVWRWVVDPIAYEKLVPEDHESDYFPRYRSGA